MADRVLRFIGAAASVNIIAWAVYLAVTFLFEDGRGEKAHLTAMAAIPALAGFVGSFLLFIGMVATA